MLVKLKLPTLSDFSDQSLCYQLRKLDDKSSSERDRYSYVHSYSYGY